jgi:hypothetical protein
MKILKGVHFGLASIVFSSDLLAVEIGDISFLSGVPKIP